MTTPTPTILALRESVVIVDSANQIGQTFGDFQMSNYLWRVNANGVVGVFTATWDDIEALCGLEVVLEDDGDDHCVTHWLCADDFTILSDDSEFIEKCDFLGLIPQGFNPLKARVRDNEGFDATKPFWEGSL